MYKKTYKVTRDIARILMNKTVIVIIIVIKILFKNIKVKTKFQGQNLTLNNITKTINFSLNQPSKFNNPKKIKKSKIYIIKNCPINFITVKIKSKIFYLILKIIYLYYS